VVGRSNPNSGKIVGVVVALLLVAVFADSQYVTFVGYNLIISQRRYVIIMNTVSYIIRIKVYIPSLYQIS
jgi:hypothetical protein